MKGINPKNHTNNSHTLSFKAFRLIPSVAGTTELEKEIEQIKKRNLRVEADKAWEISITRRAIISIGTYFFSSILFIFIHAPEPFIAALVPSTAYLISTLSLPFFKKWWIERRK